MSTFDLPDPERFVAGAIGEPGRRVFYVQATSLGSTVSLKVEKQQVAALAQYIAELLADLPPVEDDENRGDTDLLEPVIPEWVVGTIGVAYDEGRDRVVITFQEVQPDPADEDEDEAAVDDTAAAAGLMTVTITRSQSLAFVRRAAELVASGRPPCALCGRPLDPDGHVCIKTNGKLH